MLVAIDCNKYQNAVIWGFRSLAITILSLIFDKKPAPRGESCGNIRLN